MGLFPVFFPKKLSLCFLPLSARGVLMKNSWGPIKEEIVLLGRMKIIDGSLWLRWLDVTCDTFNVLTVEQRRTTGLKKKTGHHLIDKFHDMLRVCWSLPNRTAVVYTSSTRERGLKNVSVLCVILQVQQL